MVIITGTGEETKIEIVIMSEVIALINLTT